MLNFEVAIDMGTRKYSLFLDGVYIGMIDESGFTSFNLYKESRSSMFNRETWIQIKYKDANEAIQDLGDVFDSWAPVQ